MLQPRYFWDLQGDLQNKNSSRREPAAFCVLWVVSRYQKKMVIAPTPKKNARIKHRFASQNRGGNGSKTDPDLTVFFSDRIGSGSNFIRICGSGSYFADYFQTHWNDRRSRHVFLYFYSAIFQLTSAKFQTFAYNSRTVWSSFMKFGQ